MVTVETLSEYAGADLLRDSDSLTRALAVAVALVDSAFESAWRPVPEAIRDEVVLRTAFNIFKQGGTDTGNSFVSAEGNGLPGVANDPLQKSWPLIKRYINRV